MVGPILYARGADAERCRLSVLVALATGEAPPAVRPGKRETVEPRLLVEAYGNALWRYDIELRSGDAGYEVGGEFYPVVTVMTGDVRIAYVSCNGQEHGDDGRDLEERDLMWERLCEDHRRSPFALLLQGGDQLYADEAVESHPELRRWNDLGPRHHGEVAFTGEMREAARRYFFSRYLGLFAQPAIAWMVARVPSLMMWDDHDIFDGWGSHPREVQESPVGRGLFAIARETFALFQLCALPGEPPETCFDRSGGNYTFVARFPGVAVVAPDLRSNRRPDQVMDEGGWRSYEAALASVPAGDRLLLMSSVPALGPRLSWIEAGLDFLPGVQEYEDDLRDQWQSRAHRQEWRRLLGGLERMKAERRTPVTLLSGEIHLATRGEMRLGDGAVMHQLVASGISHPRPHKAYSFALGLVANFTDSPLPDRPIRMLPLPGRSGIYTAERNFLLLARRAGEWSAEWELEHSGRTPRLLL